MADLLVLLAGREEPVPLAQPTGRQQLGELLTRGADRPLVGLPRPLPLEGVLRGGQGDEAVELGLRHRVDPHVTDRGRHGVQVEPQVAGHQDEAAAVDHRALSGVPGRDARTQLGRGPAPGLREHRLEQLHAVGWVVEPGVVHVGDVIVATQPRAADDRAVTDHLAHPRAGQHPRHDPVGAGPGGGRIAVVGQRPRGHDPLRQPACPAVGIGHRTQLQAHPGTLGRRPPPPR